MLKPFQSIAVLGAGVMGSQIAAHFANAGLTVHLLELAAKTESKTESKTGSKNDFVEMAFKKALKLSPPICFSEKTSRRIILGNFDEHLDRLKEVDWVIEAVIEDLQVKQQLLERVETIIRPDTIVSTNTSGLSIESIAAGRSAALRQRFLGTHFFNPPRYLKLLELIPTPETDPQVVERIRQFGELHLGKGVVIAKDTPNFIANRIGMYAILLGLRSWLEQGYTMEEIDTLTGTLIGRPKSATFRTADLVGLDTLLYVADHLYLAVPDDESRSIFQAPDLLRQLVTTGTLGAKTGQGFYKKQGSEILSLHPVTFTYESAKPMQLGLESIAKIPHLRDRLLALYDDPGRAGQFFRHMTLEILGYSARRLPEIADNPIDIDRAMRWGFGWELGPFELWDVLGFDRVLTEMKARNILLPDWMDEMMRLQVTGFYKTRETTHQGHSQGHSQGQLTHLEIYCPQQGYLPVELPEDDIDLTALTANGDRIVWQNPEAALIDLGDGVVLYEFRSKGNTLSFQVIAGLAQVLDILETSTYQGLVIGNSSANFCGGANLAEIGMTAQSGNLAAIDRLIVDFQTILQRLHYFHKPIVAAVQGRALGGGCELVMACPHVVAAAETYIGLVEVSVGLIPGAGGLMRMVKRAAERAASDTVGHIHPFLRTAFETIAMAKVSNSAQEGQELGFLPDHTRIIMNGDRRLAVAKAEVLHLDRVGYFPPTRDPIHVLGRSTQAMLQQAAYIMVQGGYASEYDRYLADRIAYVMTGGMLTAPADVSEEYLLQLERESFVPLLSQTKTQERMAHLLKTKKPLRN